jgi:diacylglycerol diphosphate phosphatase/phosphatidate phosphatase
MDYKNLVSDLSARFILVVIFVFMETAVPFQRVIHKEELWLYSNPMTDSYISATSLWFLIVIPLQFLPLTYNLMRSGKKILSAQGVPNDLVTSFLATTLLLPLNGIITDVIKLAVGRPRPDFAYRCWPNNHGQPPAELKDAIFNAFDQNPPQDLHCHGDPDVIMQGRKSFPSGHSSFAFAVFGFAFLYLSAKLRIFARNVNISSDPRWVWKFIFCLGILLGISLDINLFWIKTRLKSL